MSSLSFHLIKPNYQVLLFLNPDQYISQPYHFYAIYNGNTPENKARGEAKNDYELRTRREIRRQIPQVLISNPSMLEYILVRQADQEMIKTCRDNKSLKWIVIDEAHTYTGSAAIELRYQIKRILEAFGRDINEVNFICTSATIGDPQKPQELLDFITTLTGKTDITIVNGQRDAWSWTTASVPC